MQIDDNYKTVITQFDALICGNDEGPQQFFRDPGIGLFQGRDSGFWRKGGTKFGIVIMAGTQDLAILTSGSLEMSL